MEAGAGRLEHIILCVEKLLTIGLALKPATSKVS